MATDAKQQAEYAEATEAMFAGFAAAMDQRLDDTARVNAASKVIDGAADLSLPVEVRERFAVLKVKARYALLDVAKNANKEPARVSAAEYLKKILKENAPAIWPPDFTKEKWKQDLNQALKLCGLPLAYELTPSPPTPTSTSGGTG